MKNSAFFIKIFMMIVLFLIMSSPASSYYGPWKMYRHDSQHTGRSIYKGAQTPELQWSISTGMAIYSSPAIGDDGTIYFGSNNWNLYAVNPDGSIKWVFPIETNISTCPAIGFDGTIYVTNEDATLFAINPDGSQKWRYPDKLEKLPFTTYDLNFSPLYEGFVSSPTIGSDCTIYYGSGALLLAINPNGTKKWSFNTSEWGVASPAIGSDGTIYTGNNYYYFYAVNPNGSMKWYFETDSGLLNSAPAIATDGTIYFGSMAGTLYALYSDGNEKWQFHTGGNIVSSPAIASDGSVIIYSSDDHALYSINPDGSENWHSIFGNSYFSYSAPAVDVDGNIYFGSNDSKLRAVNSTGNEIWLYDSGGEVQSSPAISANGTIYFGSTDGKFYAVGYQEQPYSSPVSFKQSLVFLFLLMFLGIYLFHRKYI